jgi:hypothetical protein
MGIPVAPDEPELVSRLVEAGLGHFTAVAMYWVLLQTLIPARTRSI